MYVIHKKILLMLYVSNNYVSSHDAFLDTDLDEAVEVKLGTIGVVEAKTSEGYADVTDDRGELFRVVFDEYRVLEPIKEQNQSTDKIKEIYTLVLEMEERLDQIKQLIKNF